MKKPIEVKFQNALLGMKVQDIVPAKLRQADGSYCSKGFKGDTSIITDELDEKIDTLNKELREVRGQIAVSAISIWNGDEAKLNGQSATRRFEALKADRDTVTNIRDCIKSKKPFIFA